jgi:phosphoglucosamine mutase
VVAIHAEPDGSRINVDCGSTSLDKLSRRVTAEGADLGLAFDGDADRVLAVDENGAAVDGDRLLGLLALHLMEEGRLIHKLLVSTVMANLGFKRAMEERGVEVVCAPVGDKFVAEAMTETGAVIGGEQSGHVIFAQHSTTGDGVLTGLQLAQVLRRSDSTLSALAHFFEPFPQILLNVTVGNRDGLEGCEAVWAEVRKLEDELGAGGRVVLRASGTEPLVRVMVEAEDRPTAERAAKRLAQLVEAELGA